MHEGRQRPSQRGFHGHPLKIFRRTAGSRLRNGARGLRVVGGKTGVEDVFGPDDGDGDLALAPRVLPL